MKNGEQLSIIASACSFEFVESTVKRGFNLAPRLTFFDMRQEKGWTSRTTSLVGTRWSYLVEVSVGNKVNFTNVRTELGYKVNEATYRASSRP